MKKTKYALGVLAALVFVVFNIVFFAIWGLEDMSASRWICWGIIHGAGILFAAAAHSTKTSGDGLVHSYPKMLTAAALFLAVLIAGLVLTILNISLKWTIVVLSVFVFFDLFQYVALMASEEKTMADTKRDARDRHFIESCATRLDAIRQTATDIAMRKRIESAYDAIRQAQTTSIPAVESIERRIGELVERLCREAEAGAEEETIAATVSEIVAAVRKRDTEIRLAR